jgi:chromatin assembly factor 1 subunit A
LFAVFHGNLTLRSLNADSPAKPAESSGLKSPEKHNDVVASAPKSPSKQPVVIEISEDSQPAAPAPALPSASTPPSASQPEAVAVEPKNITPKSSPKKSTPKASPVKAAPVEPTNDDPMVVDTPAPTLTSTSSPEVVPAPAKVPARKPKQTASKPKAPKAAAAAPVAPETASTDAISDSTAPQHNDAMDVDTPAAPAPTEDAQVVDDDSPVTPEVLAAAAARQRRSKGKRSYNETSDGEEDGAFSPDADSKKKRRKLTDEERNEREAERLLKLKQKEEEMKKKEEEKQRVLAEREEKKRKLEEEKAKRAEEKAKKDQERKEKEEEKERAKKEKELEKKRQEEEAKKKLEKQSNFLKGFVKKVEPAAVVVGSSEGSRVSASTGPYFRVGSFFPFEPAAGAKLAPVNVASRTLSADELVSFTKQVLAHEGDLKALFASLCERCMQRRKSSRRTRHQFEQSRREKYGAKMDLAPLTAAAATLLDPQSRRIRELVLSESIKLLKFHENLRPEYHGTWSSRSKKINPRNPLKKDDVLDYEIDSDEEWEDIADAENISAESDEEDVVAATGAEANKDEYSFDEEFLVADGYLSDGEGLESVSGDSDEENLDEIGENELAERKKNVDPNAPKRDKKALLERTKQNLRKRGSDNVAAFIIGPVFDLSTLVTPAEKKYQAFLESHSIQMLVPTPVTIGEDDDFSSANQTAAALQSAGGSEKKTGPRTKPVPEDQIAPLLKLTHGNPQGIDKIVLQFMEQFADSSKLQVKNKIMECAKKERPPGWTKDIFVVNPELRKKYEIPDVFPPPPTPTARKPRTPKDPAAAAAPGSVSPAANPIQMDANGKPIMGFFSPEPTTPKSKPKVKQTSSASRAAAPQQTPSPMTTPDVMVVDDSVEFVGKTEPRSPTKLTPAKQN